MSLVTTWLQGIGLENAEIIAAFERAGIVEPETLASLEMNQYESLGVIDASDRKKLFHLVQRVRIAVGDSAYGADKSYDDRHQKPKSLPTRKSNLERKKPHTASRQSERLLKAKLDKLKVDEDIDACSSLSESVGASSSQSNQRGRHKIDSIDLVHDSLRPQTRQSSDTRRRGNIPTDYETNSRSNDSFDTYRSSGRTRSHSMGQSIRSYSSKLKVDEDKDSSTVKNSQNVSTKALSGHILLDIGSSSLRMSAAAAAERRRTINVFPDTEISNDRTTSPLTTPESTETAHSEHSKKSNPQKSIPNQELKSKSKYRFKSEKKLSSIPAGVPAIMSPLRGSSISLDSSSGGSNVGIMEENDMNQENSLLSNTRTHVRSLSSRSIRRASAPAPHYNKRSVPSGKSQTKDLTSKSKNSIRHSDYSTANNKQLEESENNQHCVLQRKEEQSENSADNAPVLFIHGEPEDNSWGAQVASLREMKSLEFANIHSCDSEDEEDMRIRVVVRKRPMSKREAAANEVDIIHPFDSNGRLFVYQPKTRVDLTKEIDTSAFVFDNVFEEGATNSKIYDKCIKHLIPGVFEGRWVSVFAYGQTGSGKSFTMLGSNLTGMKAGNSKEDRENMGVYFLSAHDVFQHVADSKNSNLSVSVSLFEIYGGRLLDLLNNRAQIKCLEDHKGKVCFPGLSEHWVKSPVHLMQIIEAGAANRSMGSTSANADSSRSHAVLQLSLRKRGSKKSTVEHGRLSFIDLAGSERGADTNQSSRATRLEGAEINTSLLALKEVIRALAVGGTMQHIPFRGSKLTQVLKESFVGKKSRTVMIACVAPNLSNCEHTLNTLRYADRVKERNPETGKSTAGNTKTILRDEKKTKVLQTIMTSEFSTLAPDPGDVSSEKSYFDDFSSCETTDNLADKKHGNDQHSDMQLISEEECIQDIINGELRKVSKSLIASHSASISEMLNLVQKEASLVHDAGTQHGKFLEYLYELEECQALKLNMISNLRDSLKKYQDARDLIYREVSAYSDFSKTDTWQKERNVKNDIFFTEDEFEDLRD